uniref:Uncharacterized protein n=1 Tax=Onchocerca volvulus TaxID=6282 RepID=A0A8R1TIR2_ONCVO
MNVIIFISIIDEMNHSIPYDIVLPIHSPVFEDDKYEVLEPYQTDATQLITNAPLSVSSHPDAKPLANSEMEQLKSTTDLYSVKFEPEKKYAKKMPKKLIIVIYVGIMILNIAVFNIGIAFFYKLNTSIIKMEVSANHVDFIDKMNTYFHGYID